MQGPSFAPLLGMEDAKNMSSAKKKKRNQNPKSSAAGRVLLHHLSTPCNIHQQASSRRVGNYCRPVMACAQCQLCGRVEPVTKIIWNYARMRKYGAAAIATMSCVQSPHSKSTAQDRDRIQSYAISNYTAQPVRSSHRFNSS